MCYPDYCIYFRVFQFSSQSPFFSQPIGCCPPLYGKAKNTQGVSWKTEKGRRTGSPKSTSLSVLITMKSPFSPSQFSSSPVVISTIKIYNQFRQAFQLTDFSLETPICNNHLFPAAKLDATFKQWQDLGIVTCSDFFIDNIFGNYNDLIQKFYLQMSDFFRYLQVRNFIQDHCSVFPQMPSESGLDLVS